MNFVRRARFRVWLGLILMFWRLYPPMSGSVLNLLEKFRYILIPPIVIFFSFDATIVGCLCFIFLLVYCVVYPFIWTFYQWNHHDVDASKDHILIGIIDFWSFWFLLDFCMIRNLALAEANHFCNVVKFFFIISFVFHDFFVCTLTTYLYILWG